MESSSKFIKANKLIGSFVIAGLGTLTSLWTNCIFIITLETNANNYDYNRQYYNLTFQTIQYEYLVICLIANVTLIWGLTKSHRKYLIPWTCLKFCENITIFVGTIIIFSSVAYTAFIPLGIAAISINLYASLCVYKAYKRMLIQLPLKELKKDSNNSEPMQEINEDEYVKIKVEELNPLPTEISNYIISEKCEKV